MKKLLLTTMLGLATLSAGAQTSASPFELHEGANTIPGLSSYSYVYATYEAQEDQYVNIKGIKSVISVEQDNTAVSSYTDTTNEIGYFLIPANTKYTLSFMNYTAGDLVVTIQATAQEYTNAQTPETAVTASATPFFVPFIKTGGYSDPATPVYIKYTPEIDGKLTMHFSGNVSNLQYAEAGSTDYITIDNGGYANSGWEATMEVDANVEYIITGTASSGMLATFTTAEIIPGASCADAVKMISGANALPAEEGSYWYTFTTPDTPAKSFVTLTTDADLTGGKATISSSCGSTYGAISQDGELHLRLPYNAKTTRMLEIKKATALAETSAVNMTIEAPQLYDAFDTAQAFEAGQTVTTPDFGGTYYYAITAPETGNYFLDIATTNTEVPSGTQLQLYLSSDEYTVVATGTTSLHYNVEAGKKYVIKWTCPNDLRSLPFTATFAEIQQGETAGDPIIAEIGDNTIPASSDIFFSYTATEDSWLILTPSAETLVPTITTPEENPSYITSYTEDGAYRFQGTTGVKYQIEFKNATDGGSFTLATRAYTTGETSADPIIAENGEATIPDFAGTFWVRYTATEDGFVDVATTATYTTSNTLGVYVGEIANSNYTRMMSGEDNGYEILSFAVKTGDLLYVRAIIGAPESDMKFTFTQREAGPGETVASAIEIPFTENPTTFSFEKTVGWGDDPIWYCIDLPEEGLFNLVGTESFSMYMYSSDNTETSIANASGYPSKISNVSISTPGRYYFKLTSAYYTFTADISLREAAPGETASKAFEINPTENPFEYQLTAASSSDQAIWYAINLQPGNFSFHTQSADASLYKESNLNSAIANTSMSWSPYGYAFDTDITEAGKYYIKVTRATSALKATLSGTALIVDTTVGVEGIEAADAQEVVYYNLEGVRVDNPEKGVYIRVIGNRRDKVVIR